MCRHETFVPPKETSYIRGNDLDPILRRAFAEYVKRPGANRTVVSMFQRYLRAKKEKMETVREENQYRKEHKEVLQKARALRRKVWTKRHHFRSAVRYLLAVPIVPFKVPVKVRR